MHLLLGIFIYFLEELKGTKKKERFEVPNTIAGKTLYNYIIYIYDVTYIFT